MSIQHVLVLVFLQKDDSVLIQEAPAGLHLVSWGRLSEYVLNLDSLGNELQ